MLVHSGPGLLPELGAAQAHYSAAHLAARGIEVHLDTHVTSLTEGRVTLDNGHEFNSDTVIWTAGVDPHPLLAATGLALDAAGRLITNPTLQVAGYPHVFAAGDAAAVPDLTSPDPGATTAPTAQHAVRQAKVLPNNILAHLAGTGLRDYAHTHTGAVATLGRHRGVADIYGHPLTGWPAWVLHRAPTTSPRCLPGTAERASPLTGCSTPCSTATPSPSARRARPGVWRRTR